MSEPSLIYSQADVNSGFHESSLLNQFSTMLNDINFTDPPIIIILSFLAIWIFLLFYNRNNTIISSILFGLTSVLIGVTQYLDEFIHKNWSRLYFSGKYFSSSTNVFVFFFWALPLFIAAGIFLLLLAIDVIQLYMNESKKAKIKNVFGK